MPVTNDVVAQDYNGSLLALNLLSGSAINLVLSSLGTRVSTDVTENNNVLQVGETVTLGTGETATVLGSGTAQPGVNVFGLIVPTGTARAMVLVQDNVSGQLMFLFPAGLPNVLSAVALVVTMTPTNYNFPGGVICFAAGTLIRTPRGDIPVEDLRRGQRVISMDNGPRRILWNASRRIGGADLQKMPRLWPVLIPAGALGDGRPLRPLVVSPQHRLLIGTGGNEALVAAVHLVGQAGITRIAPVGGVTYHHLLLPRHELIWADGAASESLFTGSEAMRMFDPAQRAELSLLWPGLQKPDRSPPVPVRPLLTGREGRARLQGGGWRPGRG